MAKLYVNDNGTPKLLELESVGSVKTVNGVEPDSNGDVTVDLGVTSVNGSTGAVVLNSVASATQALQDGAGQQINTTYIKSVSVNGQIITFTRGDGTTFTITTQDTVTTNSSNWSVSEGTNGWARDNSTGFTIQWGQSTVFDGYIAFPRNFSAAYALEVNQVNSKNQGHPDWYVTTGYTFSESGFYSASYYAEGSVHFIAVGLT